MVKERSLPDIAYVYTIYEYLHEFLVLSTYKYVYEASSGVVKENHVLLSVSTISPIIGVHIL